MRRCESLEQANGIVIEQQRTRPQLGRLVQILDTLRRPEEARAWETLASRMPEVESSLYVRPQDTESDSARVAIEGQDTLFERQQAGVQKRKRDAIR